jgi:hypothetical protein
MTTIRREDKEIVHNLSFLGMLFGIFVGGFLVLHWNKQAHIKVNAQADAAYTQNSLVRLSGNLPEKEASLAQAAIGQVEAEAEPAAQEMVIEKNFWVSLPKSAFWGICAGAAIIGGITGYLTFWGASWLGALLTYVIIRAIYGQIRTIAPNCAAASRPMSEGNTPSFQRDQNRLLPTLIKLVMLLAIVLSVLAAIVWQLTAI